jgi:hypothetical protein
VRAQHHVLPDGLKGAALVMVIALQFKVPALVVELELKCLPPFWRQRLVANLWVGARER